jgi:hypothetical protein
VALNEAEEPKHLFRRRTLAGPLPGVQGQLRNLLTGRRDTRRLYRGLDFPARPKVAWVGSLLD